MWLRIRASFSVFIAQIVADDLLVEPQFPGMDLGNGFFEQAGIGVGLYDSNQPAAYHLLQVGASCRKMLVGDQ